VQIVYQTVTVQLTQRNYTTPQTNSLPHTVLGLCDTLHWHLKTVEHIY